jgi:hypothetical protein
MHTTLLILGLLACPLGMAAFGGIAWLGARAVGDRAREAATEARTHA